MKIPKSITSLIESFEKLPGIGPKTAQRLTFYLLHFPQEELSHFSQAIKGLKEGTKLCSLCKNVGENDVCSVCDDHQRNKNLIAVVAGPLDTFALERTGFKGVYHVLHGLIDPLNNVGPEELFINDLIARLKRMKNEAAMFTKIEVVLATNTGMEGESTAFYITKLIRESGFDSNEIKITRIAHGLPVGGDIEYADDITLTRALDGRLEV